MFRFAVCFLPALVLCAAGCNRGPRTGLEDTVSPRELATVNLGYYWHVVLPLEKGEDLARIWHVDENIYCLTDRNRLLVHDAQSGVARWSRTLGPRDRIFYAPTHCDDVLLPAVLGPGTAVRPPADTSIRSVNVVIVLSIVDAQVLDRKDGQLLHRIDFARAEFAASGPAVCDGQRLYVGTVKGWFYALDLRTGLAEWKQDAGAPIVAEPRLLGSVLYIAGLNGRLIASSVAGAQPRRLWPVPQARPQATAGFAASFVAEDRGVFAGALDYAVYALDPQNGQLLWRYPTGGAINRPIQVGATNVYARGDNGVFYALAIEPGRPREKWTLPGGRLVLAELDGKVYVVNDRNDLVMVDAAGGQVEARVVLPGLDLFVPNTRVPAIYAANRDGLVVRIDPKSHGFLRPEMLR